VVEASIESCCFKVMLHQPGDICFVFQYEYGLAQTVCPRSAADWVASCVDRTEPITE
jgi:hypothetical protein